MIKQHISAPKGVIILSVCDASVPGGNKQPTVSTPQAIVCRLKKLKDRNERVSASQALCSYLERTISDARDFWLDTPEVPSELFHDNAFYEAVEKVRNDKKLCEQTIAALKKLSSR